MDELDTYRRRLAELEVELEARSQTIAVLTERVETLEAGPPAESGAMARALVGMQHELARRTRVLEEAEATYRALYESSPDPLLTVDDLGVVHACNRTGLTWLRRSVEEVVDRPLADLFDPADRAEIERLATGGWTGIAERTFSLTDGRRVSINAAPIAGTAAPRFHLTLRDVTTRELLDEAEDQRRRMSALAELAGAIARELNDPMSIVQGRLELLLELGETDPKMVEKHVSIALDHARRISATLRNLRLVGHDEAPRMDTVFLSEVLDEARAIVGPRLRRADLRVDLEPADLAAGGEQAKYARVLANLLFWLLDASPHGGRLHVHGREQGEEVVLRIRGEGTGILGHPPELPSDSTGERFGAHGLGLSVAWTIVTAAGGRLEALRTAAGTLFSVWLPRAPLRRARALPVQEQVLVVGRDELAEQVEGLLAREGFAVRHAPHAEEALRILAADPAVDAVATELLLDGTMSGLTLAEEVVRRHPRLSGRILLVTESRLPAVPDAVVPVQAPLRRHDVLEALGRRVRRRR